MIPYNSLVESWIEYIKLEELVNLRIKKDAVKNYKLYKLNNAGSIVISQNSAIKLIFHHDDLLNYFSNELSSNNPDTDSPRDFCLLFPLLEVKDRGDSYYCPIFIIPFSDSLTNFLNLRIDQENTALVNGLRWYQKEFNVSQSSNYIVCKPVFADVFKLNDDECEVFNEQAPLITVLRRFLDLPDDTTFETAFNQFKTWIANRLKKYNHFTRHTISFFDFLLVDNEIDPNKNTDKIKKQLSFISSSQFDPVTDIGSAAYEYIYGKQESDFDKYNTAENMPLWAGTFHNFSLSYGQALLLQKFAKKEKLIAVQGPPGTGKTTVLMALIADVLTNRAVSIASGDIDYSTLILVTSTARKAVANAAREFENNEVLGNFPHYVNGAFYFNGGSSENITASLKKVQQFKNWIENQEVNPDQCEKVKGKLLSLHERLLLRMQSIKELKNRLQTIQQICGEIPNIDKEISSTENEIYSLQKVLSDNNITIDNLESIKSEYQNFLNWQKKFLSSRFKDFTFDELKQLVSLEEEITETYLIISSRSVVDKIIDIFTRRDKKVVIKIATKYRTILGKIGYSLPDRIKKPLYFLEDFKKIIKESVDLFNSLSKKEYFINPDLPVQVESYINLIERESLLQELKKIKNHFLFPYCASADGLYSLWHRKYARRTRALFFGAMRFLCLHMIKNKDTITKFLNLFCQLYSSSNKDEFLRAKSEILTEGVHKFYRWLSLVYPVHFSTLHSSPYIFDRFINDRDTRSVELLKEFKPIYLTFIDEAGMALPHLAYPAIYWSKHAIVVGDPIQIPPVVAIGGNTLRGYHKKFYGNNTDDWFPTADKFSPACTSVYHRCARCDSGKPEPTNIGQAVFLDLHRRCQPPIAELFRDIAGYKRLLVATDPLKKENQQKLDNMGGKNLIFYDVKRLSGDRRNTNIAEVVFIKSLIDKLQHAGYNPSEEICIITPYVSQELLLRQHLKGVIPEEKIGTIHKFQGVEASVVIMSPVVYRDQDSTKFIDGSPNLLNVAISRAKHLFIMVGNAQKLENGTKYFSKVVKACKHNGLFIQGIEIDETEERKKEKDKLLNFIKTNSSYIEMIPDSFAHMEHFLSLPTVAKNSVTIVCPWIQSHNLQNFSLPVLQQLSKNSVTVNIVYGYSNNEQDDTEAIAALSKIPNIRLTRLPHNTHSKILLVDNSLLIVGSFNWLSHPYYKYCKDSQELKAIPRFETSLMTRDKNIIDELRLLYYIIE